MVAATAPTAATAAKDATAANRRPAETARAAADAAGPVARAATAGFPDGRCIHAEMGGVLDRQKRVVAGSVGAIQGRPT